MKSKATGCGSIWTVFSSDNNNKNNNNNNNNNIDVNNNNNNNNNSKFILVYLEGADSIPKLDFQPKWNLTPVHSKPYKQFNF